MFWPACGHGSVLVTTQNSTLVHRAHAEVELKPFTEDEGSGLLLNYMKELEEGNTSARDMAKAISRRVCGLPLLLSGLAGHLLDTKASISEVLQDLEESSDEADYVISSISHGSATFYYDRPIEMAFNISLRNLPKAAMTILHIMSMLSPDCILEEMLINDVPQNDSTFFSCQDRGR